MNTVNEQAERSKKGKIVFWSLVTFFAVFSTVDAFFVYKAMTTHTGVITENAYEEGLAYNQVIEQAREQKDMNVSATYQEGVLTVDLKDQTHAPVIGAVVTVDIVRNIHEDHDFQVLLQHKGDGLYQKKLSLPLKGIWTANIEAKWTQQKKIKRYQTAYKINIQ